MSKKEVTWNPWHGCRKISDGCKYCYVYRQDAKFEKDSSLVSKNCSFDLPIKKNREKQYKIPSGTVVYTCFTSDFFLEFADDWRNDAWSYIKERQDLHFVIITKRIHRFLECIPSDWSQGYENVSIGCTMENQKMADYRMSLFKNMPIRHKFIICEPLLSSIDFKGELTNEFDGIFVGGESGNQARVCNYDWVLNLRKQSILANVPFVFRQTGARLLKDGKIYRILRQYQHSQAKKANINYGKWKFD